MRTRLAWVLMVMACSSDPRVVSDEVALLGYETCDALENDLKQLLIAEIEAGYDRWLTAEDTAAGPPAAAAPTTREEGTDYSGTNNQEEGVDEADLVKTDGFFIYNLNGSRLHIFGVPAFGDLDPLSVTQIEGWPQQILVAGDRLAVFSTVPVDRLPVEHPLRARLGHQLDDGSWYWRSWDVHKITLLDVADRTHPEVVRELYLEGWYQDSRRVDSSVRVNVYTWMNIPWVWSGAQTYDEMKEATKAAVRAMTLDDLVPAVYERLPDRTFRTLSLRDDHCTTFYRPSGSDGRGISTLLTFDLGADELGFEADRILSNWATFYASKDYLYLAEAAHSWWWFWENDRDIDRTNIHMFDIRDPKKTHYVGSGRVPGVVLDSFSMSEKDGYLRVATTTNWFARWWLPPDERPPTENNVFVLAAVDDRLRKVGSVTGLAEGERIFTARFVGDKGFLVTFEQIDPLFTLDLSDPQNPRAVGELETPGVSTYLHPIADGKLLSIGWGGDAQGLNWRAQLGLFDVSNFAAPQLQHTLEVAQDGWSYSEAQWEHKAFQYWAPKKLLAIPVGTYRERFVEGEPYPFYDYLSSLHLITVDPVAGLSPYGEIDHSAFYNSEPDKYWYYVDIRRSIFMGDYVYAISDRAITVNRIEGLELVNSAPLPGWEPDHYWWWW